jgi:TPR repeat protein
LLGELVVIVVKISRPERIGEESVMRKLPAFCVLAVLNVSQASAQESPHFPNYAVEQNTSDLFNYRLAAEQGNADAEVNLAFMYRRGRGVAQDYSKALQLYRLAAQRGNWSAQSNLGSMYNQGQGVTQDYVRADMWYSLAASGSSGESHEAATRHRDAIVTHLNPAQVVRAQEMARECEASSFKNCD